MAQNGRLPASDLAPIAGGQLAKANGCAASWNAMNVEARRLGLELRPTGSKSSYRTFAQQQELWNLYRSGKGNLAATPGTSNHGWGLAVDLATQSMRAMVDRIGRKYGWAKEWSDAPSEWWHIRYRSGVWSGADPGPSGAGAAAPQAPPAAPARPAVALDVGVMPDGRFEVFRVVGDNITNRWNAKTGGWSPNWQKL